jgi:hypothetical protein
MIPNEPAMCAGAHHCERARSPRLAPDRAWVYLMDMLTRARVLGILGLFPLLLISPLHADDSAKAKKPGGCVDVKTEASFASVGFDHIVTLTSGCKQAMTCTVSTNVNPDPTTVQLAVGATESVVTWRGSPAREFSADVTCAAAKSGS